MMKSIQDIEVTIRYSCMTKTREEIETALSTEKELLSILANSQDFLALTATFAKHMEQLRDYTIFIFDDQMAASINKQPPLDVTQKIKVASIVSIFQSSFCLLNAEICNNMLKGRKADFEYCYCLDLDLNMMNVLADYHNRADRSPKAVALLTELELLKSDFTCIPYLMENAKKMGDMTLEHHVIETLLIFNKFKRSTLFSFTADYPNIEQDYQDTKDAVELMKNCTTAGAQQLFRMQRYIYALLLQTAHISLYNKGRMDKKIAGLIEFINHDLGVLLERETVICYWFLKNRNDHRILKFFRAIQPNAKHLGKTLEGMSWDLFHLRASIEIGMANDLSEGMVCLHYLITQDNGLADLTNAHPIQYMIYKKGDIIPKTIYKKPLNEIITEIDILQSLEANAKHRAEICQNNKIEDVIEKLEKALCTV